MDIVLRLTLALAHQAGSIATVPLLSALRLVATVETVLRLQFALALLTGKVLTVALRFAACLAQMEASAWRPTHVVAGHNGQGPTAPSLFALKDSSFQMI